ncbi:DinI-like family protein [Moritella viscosa]|uniref:DinI-like family protein n=1 Tax=Moritella viscosa TaxID=80854 RepID=UPI00094D43DA|nr:DinI-like family protein [Moritella viscosa]
MTAELEKRVLSVFPEAEIRVRSGTSNQLEIYAKKEKKKIVSKIIENAFNEADEWLLQAV